MVPRLAVMSGFPSCGKTCVASFMAKELGYLRLSSDETRYMLFQKNYVELKKMPDREHLEFDILFPLIDQCKTFLLYKGCDVVIDSSAPKNWIRKPLLDTEYGGDIIKADKALIILDVDKEVLMTRPHPEAIEEWEKYWQEPVEGDYQILRYKNNSEEDLASIKNDLRRRFPPRGMQAGLEMFMT